MSINSKMTALADEIRELSGTTTAKSLDTMTSDVDAANAEIAEQTELLAQIATALEGKVGGSGGVTLPDLSNPANASDILNGKQAIDENGNKITGTIATVTQATPAVSIDANGKITASATQSAGYVAAGTKTGTKQLTTQAAKTITPSTSSQTAVAKNVYTTGVVTVGAIPSNYEDVSTETDAYTTKIASLETAISALETELEGKTSGGSSGGSVEIASVTVAGSFRRIYATIYTNNTLSSVYYTPASCPNGSVANVVRGSAFIVVSFMDPVNVSGATLMETAMVGESDGIYTHMFQVN